MKKNAKKSKSNQEPSVSRQRTLRLAEFVQRNLFAFVIAEGMKALDEVLEQDREQLCGPAHSKGPEGAPLRWGHAEGRLVMGGQRVTVKKPRVRHEGQEVTLPSWAAFSDEDPLDERTLEQMVLGVSTRGYKRSIEPLPDELDPHGASKSAASRRFVGTTKQKLDAWLRRDLKELRIAAIMIDGIVVEEHTVLVALGIDEAGVKHPLGLWLGATENSKVCGELLDNLIDRNLDTQRGYLFVIDGSKALRKAIRERFGERVLVQRCQEHKRRNVLSHLPKRLHPSVRKAMGDAYRSKSKATAKKRLQQLAGQLQGDHPDAAASLKEGLDETLTLKDMGLPQSLERTLSTTNPIENLNSTIRRVLRRVKRWRDGAMVKRWVGAGVLEAQRGFRKLRGHKGMPTLVADLSKHAERIDRVDAKQNAA
jgi:transposase-like protein